MVRISPTRIRILHSKSALQNWLGAGPVREQPHRVLARKALVTAHGSVPGGAAPFAATRERADFATCSKKRLHDAGFRGAPAGAARTAMLATCAPRRSTALAPRGSGD